MIHKMLYLSIAILIQSTTTLGLFGQQLNLLHPEADSNLTINSPVRKALIIAISDYDPYISGWNPINADRDAALLQQMLVKQGFLPENIQVIANHEATKKGIIGKLELLAAKINSGDIIYIHFSGHGQQIRDDNGDEIDGYDEALIPVDGCKYYSPGIYEGENHLRDDELKTILTRIRRKAGSKGSVLMTIDACHSGTATRSTGVIRGSTSPFNTADDSKKVFPIDISGRTQLFGIADIDSALAPMMVLSASAAHQNNHEILLEDGTSMGSLTYAFCRSLGSIPANSSNLTLFRQINHFFITQHPHQQPQYEGDADHLLFCGKQIEHLRFFSISEFVNDTLVRIDGGLLHGISVNSKVGFFPPDSHPPISQNPLAEGFVYKSSPLSSLIILTQIPDSLLNLYGTWCNVISYGYIPLEIKLGLAIPDSTICAEITKAITKTPFIKLTDTLPEVLFFANQDGEFQLYTLAGVPLLAQPVCSLLNSNFIAETVAQRLWMFAQANFLRKLELKDSELSMKLELIPFIPDTLSANMPYSLPRFRQNTILPEFTPGNQFNIQVVNTGNVPFYFTLLDIQPDHFINLLLPAPGSTKLSIHDLRLEPGQTFVSKEHFIIAPPFGTEMLKCIATTTPVDLSGCFLPFSQNNQTRGNNIHQLQNLLSGQQFCSIPTLRSGGEPDAMATETLIFEIKP